MASDGSGKAVRCAVRQVIHIFIGVIINEALREQRPIIFIVYQLSKSVPQDSSDVARLGQLFIF